MSFSELQVVNIFEVRVLTDKFYYLEEEKAQAYMDDVLKQHPHWITPTYMAVKKIIALCVNETDPDGLMKMHYLLAPTVHVSIQ